MKTHFEGKIGGRRIKIVSPDDLKTYPNTNLAKLRTIVRDLSFNLETIELTPVKAMVVSVTGTSQPQRILDEAGVGWYFADHRHLIALVPVLDRQRLLKHSRIMALGEEFFHARFMFFNLPGRFYPCLQSVDVPDMYYTRDLILRRFNPKRQLFLLVKDIV